MLPTSLEGQTLGKYRVLEPLGRGGMARVYRAYHPQLDRYVAVKVLRSDLVDDEEFLARFRREAQAVAVLRHPNIVQVYDFDVQDGTYYMVMELLEGDTLKARLNDYRVHDESMPWGDIVRIILDVLDGLAYAHSEGMTHRDVKPANILLTRRGEAVITDFGIAQIVGATQHTAAGALMGTLNYIAPEQGLEGQSDARSDIYSLGIVLYEMLTQRTPFDADTPLAILMKHLRDPLPLPRQVNPDIPEPLERVVLKALAKGPEDRYQSAEEMAQALRTAVEASGIEMPERISKPLSFATEEAPSESVAVLSGTARERILEVRFADGDTDPTLGRRLEAERAALAASITSAGTAPLAEVSPGTTREEKKEGSDRNATGPDIQSVFRRVAKLADDDQLQIELMPAILIAIGIVAVGNIVAVWAAGLTGQWQLFEFGWPVELSLIALGLCVIMFATERIWLLTPVGISLSLGILFSYSTITRNWEQWVFLWSFLVLLIAGSVVATIWLARRDDAQRMCRMLGLVLGFMSLTWTVIIVLMSLLLAVVTPG
jgi:serine/threonine protein kinase